MKIEAADPELEALVERVFSIVEWLVGERPWFHEGSGWYKAGEPILAWFYVVGPRAKKHPANSVLVTATKADARLAEVAQSTGNNMYGQQTPEYVVRCNDAENFAGFLEFIGRAYKARYQA